MSLVIDNNTIIESVLKKIRIISIKQTKIKSNKNIKLTKMKLIALFNSIEEIKRKIKYEVVKLLHNIGMRDNLMGYQFFLEGVLYNLTLENAYDKNYMYCIYEKEKKLFHKNIKAIERDMRYAKESTWQYKSHLYIEKTLGYPFNYKHNVPTNMELIYILTECLKTAIGY